jgi:tetratricopeptide (TPR) repeat protein
MKPHAFVAMPFGTKENVDFNLVHRNLIKPALENAGFDVFRADEEQRAGSIIPDMFQELLLSDLVVVDLSIDNPNVWYELGVRHALRPRGVIQIQAKREQLPFDVYVERALRYHLKDGVPDDAYVEEDKRKLADFATATMNSWHGRKVSPVYSLLPSLEPPEWKRLRVGNMNEFWDAQERWERRVRIAQKAGRVGDILVFAGEAPTRVLQLEARLAAGAALLDLEEFKFSLEQYELALELEPEDLKARQKKGIALGRLQRYSEAEEWLRAVARDHPEDGETLGLLGRVEKDAWISKWRKPGCSPQQMRQDAFVESALLKRAIDAYTSGFVKSPANFYPGINALALSCLLEHLTGSRMKKPERQALEGGVLWAIRCALKKDPDDYWAKATLGDLALLNDKAKNIKDLYSEAIASPQKNRFALSSTLQQIRLMKDLEFRPAELSAAEDVFEKALADLPIPEKLVPRQVFLFSGHMVDAPNRPLPRFPADKEPIAAEAIRAKLDELRAGPQDLAFCSGACGGDLLFAEACLERGLGLRVRIPFTEPEFLNKSVRFAGERWVDRFMAVKANSKATVLVMPDVLGPLPKGIDAYARNNVWQLYSALSWGPEKVNFLCLWNRQEGDGPGGTKHMYDTVTEHAGQVSVLDTTKLW